jgi:phosphate transport system substrate-binding protein
MKLMQRFARTVLAALAAGSLAAFAASAAQPAQTPAAHGIAMAGAGATFPAPLYARWIEEYRKVRPDLTFTYDAVGSGEGIKRFLEGTVDFGASDAALSLKDQAKVDPKRGALTIPMTAGMVVLAYNIPGLGKGLTLSRQVYIDIFAGKIRSWSDPRIVAANPGLSLPDKQIQPVVRRDSSGTTYAMTNHFGAADPWWATEGPGIGKLVDWPGSAMTAVGNEGVARRVQITEGSIGYMGYEFAARIGLPVATLQNKAGEHIAPSPAAGQAALASFTAIPADMRVFVPDPEGANAYPIATYSWLLLYERYQDPAKAQALKDALGWGLDQGQRLAEEMGYIPLPEGMVAKATAALAGVR